MAGEKEGMALRSPLLPMLWLAASAAQADVPAADAAWAAGDYDRAFAEAMEPAEAGDGAAQFRIGEAYRLGRGVGADQLSAEAWYFRAARRGHVAAAAELGMLYAAEHRADDAEHWLRFAADGGDAGAEGTLAALTYNRAQTPADLAEASALMARAAADGSPQARVQLARMQGTPPAPVPPSSPVPPPAPVTAPGPALPAVPAPPASIRPAAAWRVQVGAFRTRRAAVRAWAMLAAQVGAVARSNRLLAEGGRLVRVQAVVANRADAAALCRAIRAARFACFLRAPAMRMAALRPARFRTRA